MYAVERKNVAEKRTPYCDVCFRAGLSKREYTSHFVKNVPGPHGIVVCPTILNSVCTACRGRGHWANSTFCPMLRREKKQMERRFRKEEVAPVTPVTVIKKNANRFAVLEEEVPAVVVPAVIAGPTWADMARKPAPIVPVVEPVFPTNMKSLTRSTVGYAPPSGFTEDAELEALKILDERREAGWFDRPARIRWDDISDDEEEEEYYEEEEEW